MQRVARPPSREFVHKALEWSENYPGSSVRILTMSDNTQRVAVLYKAASGLGGPEYPHYYDAELGRVCPISQYPNLGKGHVVSSVPYDDSDYRKSLDAFRDYNVLAEGGLIISTSPPKSR